jgi:hypothetical protein
VAIRSGLARLEGVESISPRADYKTATCELRWKNGQFVAPPAFSNYVAQLSLGARMRGLEATIDGSLRKEGSRILLQVGGTNIVLRLAPLRIKVQKDVPNKKPAQPTPIEARAYKDLRAQWKGETHPVRITGPLVQKPGGAPIELEVRQFELKPSGHR